MHKTRQILLYGLMVLLLVACTATQSAPPQPGGPRILARAVARLHRPHHLYHQSLPQRPADLRLPKCRSVVRLRLHAGHRGVLGRGLCGQPEALKVSISRGIYA